MTDSKCFTRNKLREFLLGNLEDETCAEIDDHLRECSRCEETVISLDQVSDTLVGVLSRENDTNDPETNDRILEIAIENVIARSSLNLGDANTHSGAADHPHQIGEYEIVSLIAQGGMGTVYKAHHQSLDKEVALKVLPGHRISSPEAIARFTREMKIVGKMSHPAMVSALDAGKAEGTHYLVMELVDGIDLGQCNQKLSAANACELVRQAALGIHYAHSQGVVHRDVKPSNLMLSREGRVKVLDLGLATLGGLQGTVDKLTTVGQLMGTLDYMAPEQCGAMEDVDHRSDVYGLAATLYKLLSGVAPYTSREIDSPIKKIKALSSIAATPLEDRGVSLPEGLCQIVDRCLSKDAGLRIQSAEGLAEALEPFVDGHDLVQLEQSLESESDARAGEAGLELGRTQVEQEFEDAAVELRNYLRSNRGGSSGGNDNSRQAAASSGGRWWPLFLIIALSTTMLSIVLGGILYLQQSEQSTIWISSELDEATIDIVKVDQNDNRTLVETVTVSSAESTYVHVDPGRYRLELTHDVIDYQMDIDFARTLSSGEATYYKVIKSSPSDHRWQTAQKRAATGPIALGSSAIDAASWELITAAATEMMGDSGKAKYVEELDSLVLSGDAAAVEFAKARLEPWTQALSENGLKLEGRIVNWFFDRSDSSLMAISEKAMKGGRFVSTLNRIRFGKQGIEMAQCRVPYEGDGPFDMRKAFHRKPSGVIRKGDNYYLFAAGFGGRHVLQTNRSMPNYSLFEIDVATMTFNREVQLLQNQFNEYFVVDDIGCTQRNDGLIYLAGTEQIYQIKIGLEGCEVNGVETDSPAGSLIVSDDGKELFTLSSTEATWYDLDESRFGLSLKKKVEFPYLHHSSGFPQVSRMNFRDGILAAGNQRLVDLRSEPYEHPLNEESKFKLIRLHPTKDVVAMVERDGETDQTKLTLSSFSTNIELHSTSIDAYLSSPSGEIHWLDDETLVVIVHDLIFMRNVREPMRTCPDFEFVAVPPIKVRAEEQVSCELEFTSADDEEIQFEMKNAPEGAKVVGNQFMWVPSAGQSGKHEVEIEATVGKFKPLIRLRVEVEKLADRPGSR